MTNFRLRSTKTLGSERSGRQFKHPAEDHGSRTAGADRKVGTGRTCWEPADDRLTIHCEPARSQEKYRDSRPSARKGDAAGGAGGSRKRGGDRRKMALSKSRAGSAGRFGAARCRVGNCGDGLVTEPRRKARGRESRWNSGGRARDRKVAGLAGSGGLLDADLVGIGPVGEDQWEKIRLRRSVP